MTLSEEWIQCPAPRKREQRAELKVFWTGGMSRTASFEEQSSSEIFEQDEGAYKKLRCLSVIWELGRPMGHHWGHAILE
jgi:hypothetical protein